MTPTEQARAVVEALERELTDAVQSVAAAPLRTAGAFRIYTPQIDEHQVEQWREALSAARSLLLGLEREQGWQPIESAPKDGTAILVTRHMGHWGWVRGYARWEEANYRNVGVFAGWISHGFTDPPGELGLAHPTHWRPLPAPPESPEEAK